MSTENKETQPENDELLKSIDSLIDEYFTEPALEESSEEVEKSIDIAGDSKTKADEAANQAPKGQKDEARGAGRPKQISDVPQNDQDGARAKDYDGAISENEGKEDEPDEAKKQAQSVDQTSDKGRMSGSSKAPKSAPFKKSEEESDVVTLSKAEFEELQSLKKAKEDAEAEELKKAQEAEELKKAEEAKKEQEALIKAAVQDATSDIRKENEELRKSLNESSAILKAMAGQPQRAKSVTGIEQLEKSVDPDGQPKEEKLTKSDILDAAEELVMKGQLSDEVVTEIEMTHTVSDPQIRAQIEKYANEK